VSPTQPCCSLLLPLWGYRVGGCLGRPMRMFRVSHDASALMEQHLLVSGLRLRLTLRITLRPFNVPLRARELFAHPHADTRASPTHGAPHQYGTKP
jgi:hypothetical protein